jgi:hypothetical protein
LNLQSWTVYVLENYVARSKKDFQATRTTKILKEIEQSLTLRGIGAHSAGPAARCVTLLPGPS